MGYSRIQKYKDYRNSLIKEDIEVLKTPNKSQKQETKEEFQTTSTLPMDEVIGTIQEREQEDVFIKKEKTYRVLKMVLIIVGIIALIVGIIVFGIFAFGGK